jgi:hypothetical protein
MKINNNELVMPNNYSVVNEEEMTYVDGGWSLSPEWFGFSVTLTEHEADVIGQASNYAAAVAATCALSGNEVPAAVSAALWVVSSGIGLQNSYYHRGVKVTIRSVGGIDVSPIYPPEPAHSGGGHGGGGHRR